MARAMAKADYQATTMEKGDDFYMHNLQHKDKSDNQAQAQRKCY